jgi:hypothetical protein
MKPLTAAGRIADRKSDSSCSDNLLVFGLIAPWWVEVIKENSEDDEEREKM